MVHTRGWKSADLFAVERARTIPLCSNHSPTSESSEQVLRSDSKGNALRITTQLFAASLRRYTRVKKKKKMLKHMPAARSVRALVLSFYSNPWANEAYGSHQRGSVLKLAVLCVNLLSFLKRRFLDTVLAGMLLRKGGVQVIVSVLSRI